MNVLSSNDDLQGVNFETGAVILVNKPYRWTSFDVVNKIRYALRKKYDKKKFKVGHNGTLDPLATGLLMIFVGKYTKLIPKEENHDKRYEAVLKFGATTASLDRETEEIDVVSEPQALDKSVLENTIQGFLGEFLQEIPIYSATKIKGKRMYNNARKGIEMPKRYKTVEFHELKMEDYTFPYATVDVLCGKGTYIRAFARDIGGQLDMPSYLYDLKRTAISKYHSDDAWEVDDIVNAINAMEI